MLVRPCWPDPARRAHPDYRRGVHPEQALIIGISKWIQRMSNGGLGRVGQLILPMMDDTTIASKTFYIFVLPLKNIFSYIYRLNDRKKQVTIRLMHDTFDNQIVQNAIPDCSLDCLSFGFGLKLLRKQLFCVHLFAQQPFFYLLNRKT